MPKFYAVKKGRRSGVYQTWDECKAQVFGVSGAIYKSFPTATEALSFVDSSSSASTKITSTATTTTSKITKPVTTPVIAIPALDNVRPDTDIVCWTDGSCDPNPGPSGAGGVLLFPVARVASIATTSKMPAGRRFDASTGRAEFVESTGQGTNNVGELVGILIACQWAETIIRDSNTTAQEATQEVASSSSSSSPSSTSSWSPDVYICSDSIYAINTTQGLWQRNANLEILARIDIAVARLRKTIATGRVRFVKVPAHCGVVENERADALAKLAARGASPLGTSFPSS